MGANQLHKQIIMKPTGLRDLGQISLKNVQNCSKNIHHTTTTVKFQVNYLELMTTYILLVYFLT